MPSSVATLTTALAAAARIDALDTVTVTSNDAVADAVCALDGSTRVSALVLTDRIGRLGTCGGVGQEVPQVPLQSQASPGLVQEPGEPSQA